jgi:hypothetical protein
LRRFLTENGLGLAFGAIFVIALAVQSIVGYHDLNNDAIAHAQLTGEAPDTITYGRYLTSSHFGRATMENWQSEYLQFTLFILGTVWLVQRGSPESKELGKAGPESEREQKLGEHARSDSPLWARVGGVRTFLYSNSLLLVMTALFIGSWFAHSVTGWSEYNAEQVEHEQARVSWVGYLGSASFWESTLQNWQSEFLAVGSMAVLSIYLRQRGHRSPSPSAPPTTRPACRASEEPALPRFTAGMGG